MLDFNDIAASRKLPTANVAATTIRVCADRSD